MTSPNSSNGLTQGQIHRLVNKYIGVNGGYLGDFSYRNHAEFYIALDIPVIFWLILTVLSENTQA